MSDASSLDLNAYVHHPDPCLIQMNPKEIKQRVKKARDFIQEKKFQDALDVCTEVIEADASNYICFVFAGRCAYELENYSEAEDAYKKALEVDRVQELAWQGLYRLYEKKQPSDGDLESCLTRMQEIYKTDPDKWTDVTARLCMMKIRQRDFGQVIELAGALLASVEGENQKKLGLIRKIMLQLPIIPYEDIVLDWIRRLFGEYNSDCANSVSNDDHPCDDDDDDDFDNGDAGGNLVFHIASIMYENKRYGDAFNLVTKDPPVRYDETTSIMIAKIRLESYVTEGDAQLSWANIGEEITLYESSTSIYVDALECILEGDFDIARKSLTPEAQDMAETDGILTCLLGEISLRLHDCRGAETLFRTGISLLRKRFPVCQRPRFLLASALKDQCSDVAILKSIEIFRDLLNGETGPLDKDSVRCELAVAEAECGNFEDAYSILNQVNDNDSVLFLGSKGWVAFLEERWDESTKLLEKALEQDPENAVLCYQLGRCRWDRGSRDQKSLQLFHSACKLDPLYPQAWLYMGHYFMAQGSNSLSKAIKCLERVLALDPESMDAGRLLVDAYAASGDASNTTRVLQELCIQFSPQNAKFAWLRLGRVYLAQHDGDKAVATLQTALRYYQDDLEIWNLLAEAYHSRGSFETAIKAYQHVLEDETSTKELRFSARYRIAAIKLTQKLWIDAAPMFDDVVGECPDFVPGIVGLVTALLNCARDYVAEGRFSRAFDTSTRIFAILGENIDLFDADNSTTYWKLVGDAACFVYRLPRHLLDSFNAESLNAFERRLEQTNTGAGDNADAADAPEACPIRSRLLRIACRAYRDCINFKPKCVSLYQDLGLALFSEAMNDRNNNSFGEDGKVLAANAIEVLKRAVELRQGSDPISWTYLGMVAASPIISNVPFAQHCFIKALNVNINCGLAWTNLGLLYLQQKQVELAHSAFKQAQSAEPAFANAWMGQAIIAEEVKHDETMDLFRHTASLSLTPDALIGYGTHVLSMLTGDSGMDRSSLEFIFCIQKMYAIPSACDMLSAYTNQHADDAYGWYLLGCMQELDKMPRNALSSYQKALSLSSKDARTDLSSFTKQALCRVYGKLGLSQNMRRIGGRMGPNCLELNGIRALAFWRLEQLDKAKPLFDDCVYLTQTTFDKRDVETAHALLHLQNGSLADAKFVLQDQSISDEEIHPATCVAQILIAISSEKISHQVLTGQFSLLAAATNHMFWVNIAIEAMYCHAKELPSSFGPWLVFHFPHCDAAWEFMGVQMLQQKHGKNNTKPKHKPTDFAKGSQTSLLLILQAFEGEMRSSLQSLVHNHPDNANFWELLRKLYFKGYEDEEEW